MKKSKIVNYIIGSFFALFAVLLVWTIWANTALELNQYSISSKSLPDSFAGFRIAHVSDLHNAQMGENNERLIKLLESSEPDIISITGDIVDCHRTDIDVAADFVRQAMKIAPCYYVTGNHEASLEDEVYRELEARLSSLGLTMLRNESVIIERDGEAIEIIGLDDPEFAPHGEDEAIEVEHIESLTMGDSFTLLLSHKPEFFEEYVKSGVELVLCGHTHGGQFRLPFVGGLIAPGQGLFPVYDAGLFSEDNTHMIVNRGIGNSLMPIRFNNRPEIIIIELEK